MYESEEAFVFGQKVKIALIIIGIIIFLMYS